MSEHSVVLYSTSVPALPKVRSDIATIKRILDAKRVQYEEVSMRVLGRSGPAVAVHVAAALCCCCHDDWYAAVVGCRSTCHGLRSAERICLQAVTT
jgi:hypothetical protein